MKCPTCGHTPATKRPKPIETVDVAGMNESALRAYLTRTTPFYDVQFMIDNGRGLSAELLADARALSATVDASGRFVAGMTRTVFYRQYYALSARRREERDAIHWRTVVIPAQKARAWANALSDDTSPFHTVTIGTLIAIRMMLRSIVATREEYAAEALAA